MAGTITTAFTKANCDTPGMFGVFHDYHMHPSGLCHLAAWLPSLSFQDAPCIVFVGGAGYGNSPGWNQITGVINNNPKFLELAKQANALGWVVISIEYPASGANEHTVFGADYIPAQDNGGFRMKGTWKEITPIAPWPEQPGYVAIALQYIKDNCCGIDGPNLSIFGKKLVGIGCSIDPGKIVLAGSDYGATMAAYVALQTTGFYMCEPGVSHDGMDPYIPTSSHQVAACVLQDPIVDWTQFVVDDGYTSPAFPIFAHDHIPCWSRCEDYRPYSDIPQKFKRQSAYWMALRNYAEQGSVAFFTEFTGVGFEDPAWDINLDSDDWSPGTPRDAAGKMFIDPRNGKFMGPNWHNTLRTWGTGLSGSSGAKIRTSVTRYYGGDVDVEPYASASEYATAVLAKLATWGVSV